MTSPPTLAAPGVSERFGLILGALCRAAAAYAGRDRSKAPLVLLLWPYLNHLAARFAALARRFHDGRLAPRAAKPTSANRAPRPEAPDPPPRQRLPKGFAWLIQLAPETAALASQLRTVLADPEMAVLLEAAPQAARMLRPLCRMLGIGPDPDLPKTLIAPPGRRPQTVTPPSDGTDSECSLPRHPLCPPMAHFAGA